MNDLLAAIQKNHDTLLREWLKNLKSVVRRRDLIGESELEAQTAEILSAIADVPPGTSLENPNAPGWQHLKSLLADLSISRATQGFSPSETALFVLSL
jgi:rsbT co-antagonist protein RsbR